jgi:phosphate transport system protein
MNKTKFGGTIRFQELMKKNVERLRKLANLTDDMLKDSVTVLINDDEELFNELEISFEKVREYRVDLEKSIVNSIVLHQPFATDLRFLISSLKIANEIERTARDAVHIAHSSQYIDRSMKNIQEYVSKIIDMAKKANKMYSESIQFFLNREVVDTEAWTKQDDEIDELHKQLIDEVIDEMQKNGNTTRAAVSLILSIRYIERIADHACNISEESTFVAAAKRDPID